MVIEQLGDRECRTVLAGTNLARLACALNNQPYIVPIHVEFQDPFLYGFATLGQKIEWMRQNPMVCLEIDDITTDREWTSVVVFGRYEELPDTPEHAYPRSVAERLFQKHPVWWEPASVPLVGQRQRAPIVFRIELMRMTGRRARLQAATRSELVELASDSKRPSWLVKTLRRVLGPSKVAARSRLR
jgi:nitroimidazol reductase NimA-like FMN-containing flavoprotein (pyridoxamine 5'-phosphate oxidase superfamily)